MKEPKIRFKGFKGEWENTPFSETFDSLKTTLSQELSCQIVVKL